jgi:branched-chain amino acid transport system ATP-binding protein
MADPILALTGLRAGYGKTVVLENLDFTIAPGESVSVIGRNGVGKTTLLGTIMGHTTLHVGRILLDGADIARAQIQDRVRAGIGYVPQEREVFPSLTVEENLDVAARPGGDWSRDRVYDLFSNLAARRANRGNQLSGGEQQMLAIGRALMGNPRVLLMDEPSEGLAPVIVEELQKAMARLRADGGMTMILVEQNIRVALGFGERTIVMNRGTIIHDGPSAALEADPDRVVELMGLGEGAAG